MNTAIRLLLVCMLFHLSACTTRFFGDEPRDSTTPTTTAAGPASYHYDFDDILIPRDMKLQPRASLVIESPGVKAGLLVFRGRVDPVSLISFFTNNMLKDGWQMSSQFRYQRTLLVFTKPDRDCIIKIRDGRFTTHLEVWIAPKTTAAQPSAVRQERILTQ